MKIPARYIGMYAVALKDPKGVLDGDGNPIKTALLHAGDIIMMNEEEILGQTYFRPPYADGPLKSLGAGRVILPEHADLDAAGLERAGYQYHEGRSDFEPVVPVVEPEIVETPPATKSSPKKADAATK